MKNTSIVGKLGEDLACDYLKDKGFKIIDRNFRQPWGEIDIIAKDKGGTLVFVEVKAMKNFNPAIAALRPEDNLTGAKLKKLQKTASLYVGGNSDLVNDKRGWRIDLVAIDFLNESDDLTELKKHCEIRYFENI